jgi:oxygen-independent coproporphyrinogen-3 oxidase
MSRITPDLDVNTPTPQRKSSGVPLPLQADSHRPGPAVEALYFHVPFCFHKCHYCDFYSIVDAPPSGDGHPATVSPTAHPARQQPFLDRLLAELACRATQARIRPRTVFVGGGTPTLLAPYLWERWLRTMRDEGMLEGVVEFTVEANPETVTPELMKVLVAGGVNRISLGAQSFHPALLRTLERWHDPMAVVQAARMVRDAGIANFNLDLIFAIPGQTLPMLDADLDRALELGPAHLSCYSLIYEPNTAMNQRMKMGQVTPMDEESERAMYGQVIERLAQAGFEHYEVSNWARREEDGSAGGARLGASPFRCLHNLLYWKNANWLGIGPAAASHVDGHRWKNEPHLGRYLATTPEPPTTDHEHLPADQSIGEQLMLLLRLREGAPIMWLDAHLTPDDERRATIDEMTRLGMLERTATHLRLTAEGLFIADAVLAKLL